MEKTLAGSLIQIPYPRNILKGLTVAIQINKVETPILWPPDVKN